MIHVRAEIATGVRTGYKRINSPLTRATAARDLNISRTMLERRPKPLHLFPIRRIFFFFFFFRRDRQVEQTRILT